MLHLMYTLIARANKGACRCGSLNIKKEWRFILAPVVVRVIPSLLPPATGSRVRRFLLSGIIFVTLKIISFKELLSLPDTFNWLIDGIAPEIGIGFIAGRYSVGKSWLTQSLVLSIATGRKWLGKFPVKQGRVLMIDEENAQPLITLRMKQLCAGMGISKKQCADLPISYAIKQRMNFSLGRTGKPSASYNDLCEWSEKHKPVAVFCDSLTRVHTNNEDKSYEMRPVFENIDKYCQQFNTVAIYAHHAGHDGDRMRGTVDLYGASDWSLFVKRKGDADNMTMTITQDKARWAAAINPFEVKMKSSADSFRIVYNGKNDLEIDADGQKLIDVLGKAGGSLDMEKLKKRVGYSQATLYRVRISLLEKRVIDVKKNGHGSVVSLTADNMGLFTNGNGRKHR